MNSTSAVRSQEWRPGLLPHLSRDPYALRRKADDYRNLADTCLTPCAERALRDLAATFEDEAAKLETA